MKLNKRQGCLAALSILAATVLSGCVSLTPDYVYPLGSAGAVDTSFIANADANINETIRTAKTGDIILEQGIQNTAIYMLENAVEPVGNISLAVQEREVEFKESELYYPAINVGTKTVFVVCSFDRPATWTPRLNPGASAKARVCFEIEEMDTVDSVMAASEARDDVSSSQFFFVADGYIANGEASAFEKLSRWDPQFIYDVSEPARFKLADVESPNANASPMMALRYIATKDGGQFEPVYLSGEQPSKTTEDPIVISADAAFPYTVDYDGAKIEVLALNEGVLAYRVLSGFSMKSSFAMDLPQ